MSEQLKERIEPISVLERIMILEAKIAFVMAQEIIMSKRLDRLENVPPSEFPPPQPEEEGA